jgi:hypothetical protein
MHSPYLCPIPPTDPRSLSHKTRSHSLTTQVVRGLVPGESSPLKIPPNSDVHYEFGHDLHARLHPAVSYHNCMYKPQIEYWRILERPGNSLPQKETRSPQAQSTNQPSHREPDCPNNLAPGFRVLHPHTVRTVIA